MKGWLHLFLFFIAFCVEAKEKKNDSISWSKEIPGGFSASATASPNHLAMDQLLNIELNLTFPATHTPHIAMLTSQLLADDSFGTSPFALISQKESSPFQPDPSKQFLSQKLQITLTPRLTGRHFLTFYAITFTPKTDTSLKPAAIVSGIIPIDVTASTTLFDPTAIAAPPLPLSLNLPIAMSTQNRRAFIANNQLAAEAAKDSIKALHRKTIPWQTIPAAIVVLTLILIIKMPKAAPKEVLDSDSLITREKPLQQLKKLSNEQSEAHIREDFFLKFDTLIRSYIEERNHTKASALTSSEFLENIMITEELSDSLHSELKDLLHKIDQIKFANDSPSLEERQELFKKAKHVITLIFKTQLAP